MNITEDQLKHIAVYASDKTRKLVLPFLNAAFVRYQINTPQQVAAFLAQVLHESGSFHYTQEIADGTAYEGRKDLGNIHTGDGVRYKGRGLIQITGRANYADCGRALSLDLIAHPELLEQLEHAVNSAAWFWSIHNCNALADVNEYKKITKVINGGYNGQAEREILYGIAKKALGI